MTGASARKSVEQPEAAERFSAKRAEDQWGASAPGPCDQTNNAPGSATIRIDKWLFHARFYRTRALAQAAASAGKVRLNGVRVEKPAQIVKPGDILTLGHGGDILALKVLGLAQRRGPAPQARLLYEIVAE